MAVTVLPTNTMSESIKQAVRSTSTCSDVTVLSLQTLLRGSPKVPEKPVRRATKTTKEATTTTSRARAATRATKARTPTDVTLHIVDQDGATLSPQEKLVLATEVFNTTLKTLTDASKTATTRRPAAVLETVSVKSGRTNGSVVDKGAAATAECARLALATLRALKTETQSSNDYPNMQLEQGACILAGKMITLGLNEMACKELRALKRRIQQYLDARAVGKRTGSTKDNAEEDTGKERMSDLLTFSNIAHAGSVYSLLVPYHANVMRLLAADRKPSTTARLISFVQLADPSSPASVILAAMESGNLTSEKAALQLQLLSNTILSLCPSKSMSTDEATTKDSLQPVSILSLQLLSLEIRTLSWKLSGHVCQETKELVDPLLRYLGSFSHRSKSVEKSEFGAIFKTITRIQTCMAEVKKQRQENKDITASARIMTVLGQLALDAGCFEESLKLFNKAVIPFFNAQSLALATARCKIAAVYFQGLKGSQKFAEGALKAISEASTALGMQLRGNVNDLDELLVEAARLKKLALAWFGDAMGKEDNTEKDEIASNMREYLQAFLRLLRRYVGRPPAEECDEKEMQLYKSRITMSKNIILAGVDSVVAIGRLSIMSQKPSWADMLPILADSHRLLTSVETADGVDSDPAFAENVNVALVKLSNLFWSRFVKEKEAGQGYRELIPLLKQSTSLLGTCPITHRKSAFAALKYERTAHVYMDASRYDDAEHAFRSSILEYVDAGVLEDVAKVSAGASPHIIEHNPKSSAFAFTRVLSAFLKLKLRKKGSKSSSPLIYDDERLDSRSRGTLIEWQMGLLCDLRSYASSDEGFRALLNPVVHLVMDLYLSNVHHVRRARVLLFALRFSLEHPPCMSVELTNKVLEEAAQVLNYGNGVGLDPDMTSFETHITNSLRVIVGFHHGKIDESELNDTLSSWSAMIRQCTDAESLSHSITDVDYWVLQLKALVDYTEIHSLWKTQLSVLELILRVAEIMKSGDFSDAISILARLVIQHCHFGHCQKAGDLLARGEQYVDHSQTSIIAKIAYQLARVEYLLETGDIEKADHVLATARLLYEKGRDTEELKNLTGLAKISLERLVADAAFIHSRLSTAQGSMTQALYFAKLAVRLNCRIWAKVEKLAQKKQARVLPSPTTPDVEVVTDGVAQIDLSQNEMPSDSSTTYVQGAPFWPHLGSHHSSLLNLATLSAHHGLFQDAIYYGEQALKIDRTLDANVRMIAAQTQLGSYRIIGGHLSEGQELLAAASESSKHLQTSVESVALHLALASFYESQEQHEKALRVLREADKLITSLIASDAVPSLVSPNVGVLDEKMAKLQVRSSRKTAATPAPATPARRTRAASSAAAPRTTKKATASKAPPPEIQSSTLLRLRSLILRQQADCLRALRDFDGSAQSLIEARQCATARESKVSVEIGESEHLLADAIRHFASHAVYCVLPESTISLPSLTSPVKGGEQITPVSVKPTAAKKTRTPARTTRTKAQKASEDFVMMLSKANDCLMGVFSDATVLGSTLDSHAASRLMSRISMLSHATTPGGSAAWVQSPANMNEIGRVGAFARERMAIDFDRKLSDFGDPLLWPTSVPQNDEISGDICSNFAEKYVDILPENWNVLSLSLSADGSEFYVSRLQRNRSPFLLRLPLRRGNSEEDEEEQFTFEDGKEEMQELIKLANQSAHAAKAQTTKQMKKEWWKNREDLDRRMESLLQNVENVWFGGFRGIFSPLARNSDAFGRFVDAFQSILDKHLPSRQKGGKASTPRLVLHQNVLELFIGLRDLEDQEEPDDILMDLLYFVVDILQFQGERNAYDEIDFDMMVVDTLDALRGYHEAAREDVAADSPRHTVLVLDKALHLFPWESLPCLQSFPVCRVPSLECLRDRVLQFRGSQAGATIQRTSGTYLLNPTGDLRSTQDSFEPGLSRLQSWTGMVNREPSEEEFRSALETKDLFLYFGHGSGAQYIRGRTVKRLTKCAVAFLMGCSSGTLTEAGEYEPYGTPMNYLQAGSPALVATLWDVTDKDIDRFATSTFDSWGLLDRKGNSPRESQNSLDAAVAGARASCVLKYLNGAAPVVYGVPVFLE